MCLCTDYVLGMCLCGRNSCVISNHNVKDKSTSHSSFDTQCRMAKRLERESKRKAKLEKKEKYILKGKKTL